MELFIFPWVAYQIINNKYLNNNQLKNILIWMPFMLLLIIFEVIISYFMGIAIGSNINSSTIMDFHRFSVVWGKSNYLAAVIVLLLLFSIGIKEIYKGSNYYKKIINILVGTSIVVLLIIMSRGALIALAVGVIVFLIINYSYNKKINLLQWVLIAIISNIFVYKFIKNIFFRFTTAKTDASFMSRIYMWYDGVQKIRENILIGTGPKQTMFNDFYALHYDPHNIFLRYGVDLGILSSIAILIILFIPIWTIFKKYKTHKINIYNIAIVFLPAYFAAISNTQIEITITSISYGMQFWFIFSLMIYYLENIDNLK